MIANGQVDDSTTSTGEISQLPTTVGADGKERQTQRKPVTVRNIPGRKYLLAYYVKVHGRIAHWVNAKYGEKGISIAYTPESRAI